MYVPEPFQGRDRTALLEIVDEHPFATLVTAGAGDLDVSHVPLLREGGLEGGAPGDDGPRGRLVGHVARANPHWRRFDGHTSAAALFHGPHAYVSPSWYVGDGAVPTWNYAVVHVHGRPRVLGDDAEADAVLERLVERFEGARPSPWRNRLSAAQHAALRRAIVAFELPVERVEAKLKLGQNRTAEDREGMLQGLDAEARPGAAELAAFTRRWS